MENSAWKQWATLGGIVAKELGLISDEQVARICRVQGFLIAAKNAGIEITREAETQITKATPQQMQEIAQAKGVDWVKVEEETAKIGLNSQVPQGVPQFMNIAEVAGILPKNKSGIVLAAQAAARMADTVQQLETAQIQPKPLEEVLKPRLWIDNGIDKGEQKYTVAAQATQHLSEIFAAGLAAKPHLADDQKVRKAMMAFQLYASQTLKRAGGELEDLGLPAAGKQVKDSRDSLHFAWDRIKSWLSLGIFSEFANTRSLVSEMKAGLDKLGLPLSKEQSEMIASRLERAKGMEHKGIPFPTILRKQHEINAKSWAQRVEASKGGGMTHGH